MAKLKINNKPMSLEEILTLIKRLKEKRLPLPLVAEDSDTPGDKHSETSWGLCTVDPEIITTDLRTWPDRELLHGQVYGVRDHGMCPFDTFEGRKDYGCFHRCRIFKHGLKDREEAEHLFDLRIAQIESIVTQKE